METLKSIIRIIRVYLRVSSERQEKEETIKTQKSAVLRFIKEKFGPDCEVQFFYEDDGYSGEYLERPMLDKMRADLEDDDWNTLVTYSPDRLSRDFNHGNMLVDEILNAGKEIFYVEGPSPSLESKLITRIMSAISDDDKEKILKKLYNGKLERAENNVINNSVGPYGYDLIPKSGSKSSKNFVQTHLKINEEEARVVRMIFDWVANDRLSTRQVVLKLKELGIQPRKSERGVWNPSTLGTLLKNETYIGKARFRSSYAVEPDRRLKPQMYPKVKKTSRRIRPKKDWMYIDKGIPAILEGEEGVKLFNKAQQQLKNNRRESTTGDKPQTTYLLGGRIRCTCGYTRNRSGSQERKNIYYVCASRKSCFPDKPCEIGGVNTRIADEYLWNHLSEVLTDPIKLSSAVRDYYKDADDGLTNSDTQALTLAKKQIEKLEGEKKRIKDMYRRGIIEDLDEVQEELTPIKRALKTATKKKEILESKLNSESTLKMDDELLEKIVCYAPDALKELSFEDKKEIVLDSISNIVAVPGTLDVSGSLEVQEGILLTDRNKLKLKGNKANIATPYYVYLKTISRYRWSPERREVNPLHRPHKK